MKSCPLLFPILLALALAGYFVITQPGPIAKDAAEYDVLAASILQGGYEIDGAPSMLREPGYPMFRALLKSISSNPSFILWVQVALFVAVVWLVGDAARRIEPHIGSLGAWAAALAYGLAIYSAQHYLEAFTAAVLALSGWLLVRAVDDWSAWKWHILLAVTFAILLLTRMSFLFVPPFIFLVLGIWRAQKTQEWLRSLVQMGLLLALVAILISPWVIRNGRLFDQWTITQRTGITLYARSIKAEASWKQLWSSYGSVFVGRSIMARWRPEAKPIIFEPWPVVWEAYHQEIGQGKSLAQADHTLRTAAVSRIFQNFNTFFKYCFWSGVDLLRLLALPSLLSPTFGIEGMFTPAALHGALTIGQWLILFVAHMLQLVWWILIPLSVIFGFKRYGVRFAPGLLFVPFIVAHLGTDNITRYAAPFHPWLLASMMIWLSGQIQAHRAKKVGRLDLFSKRC